MASRREGCRAPLLLLLLLAFALHSWNLQLCVVATPLSVVQSVHSLWGKVALDAAEETIKAIQKSSGIELSLRDVPMDTFQVFVGRQHQLGVEVEGVTYELMLGNEADLVERAKALPAAGAKDASATGLVAQDWLTQQGAHALSLPELTLAGPLELVLPAPEPIGVFTPLAADVGVVRRVFVDAGAAVALSGIKRITLRQPVDLPRLPGQYLAEVYATMKLGQPEEGFNFAPGILYMASQLRKRALNSSVDQRDLPLLSFEVAPVTVGALTLRSAPERADMSVAPRLKVRKLRSGVVELTLRQGELSPAAAQPDLRALTHVWAWPLPHLGMSAWVPYETVLRSVLAAHPFKAERVIKHGIGLRLTKSSIQGVNLVSFDMEVRAHKPRPAELPADAPFEFNESPLEVWEAVVQVQALPGGGHAYVPLHVKRKSSYQNTLTLSRSAITMAVAGGGNATGLPHGYEQEDLGIARAGGQLTEL